MILFNPQWTSKTSESAVKPAEPKPAPVAPVAVEAGHEPSNRLLVVDDNPSTCNFVKKVEAACEAGDKSAAAEALKAAQPEMARGVARGVLHKNTVARKMSRLSKRVAAL